MGAPGIREAIFQHMKAHLAAASLHVWSHLAHADRVRQTKIAGSTSPVGTMWLKVTRVTKGLIACRMRLGCFDQTVPDNA